MLPAALAKYLLVRIAPVLVLFLLGYEYFFAESWSSASHSSTNAHHAHHDFWISFSDSLARGEPSFKEIRRTKEMGDWVSFHRHGQDFSRPDYLNMTTEETDELRYLRAQAVDDCAQLAKDLPYVAGTKGIVSTGHPDSFAMMATSLYMLRAAGSRLKVEIWLYDQSQYEEHACERIFKPLDAHCMFMTDHLPDTLQHPLKIVKFTYKSLAILFSSFEQVLFLDIDVFPVMNPDDLFDSEPFRSSGALLWPDYWADT